MGPQKGMGPKQIHKKETILSQNDEYGKIVRFHDFFGRGIFQNDFSPKAVQPEASKIEGPIWRFKDHLVMKGLSKNVKNHEF